ncbi:MAG: hypothetical protein ACLQVI_32985 [Polyangiaceae bacterium]
MTTTSVELKTSCKACGEHIPINAVVEQLECSRCHEAVRLDVATWKKILEAPALDGPRAEPGKHDVSVIEVGRSIVRNFAKKDASCARCGGTIPLPEALEHAARGWCACAQCGERVSVRPLPPAFAGLGGITHLVGEDFGQLGASGPGAPATSGSVTVSCPACGGVLGVDALSLRSAPCKYCGAGVVLPDAVWQKLHPTATQRAWYLRHAPVTAVPVAEVVSFKWDTLDTCVVDADGNVYLIAASRLLGRAPLVWSYDPTFRRRWRRDDIPDGHTDMPRRLAVTADGHLLKWGASLHGLLKLSCADGSTVATLGGPEPEGATAHHLDMQHCDELVPDIDGTLLGFIHHRILRWAPDGTPVETWAPTKGFFGGLRREKLGPLYRSGEEICAENAPRIGALKDRPTAMHTSDRTFALMDRAGSLYITESGTVQKLGHDGARAWSATLPSDAKSRPGIDARGYLYALVKVGDRAHGVCRVSPDGNEVKLLIDGGRAGTPICEERCLAVLPDGTLWVLGNGGSARAFAPDGSARFASDEARRCDAEREKRRADEAR